MLRENTTRPVYRHASTITTELLQHSIRCHYIHIITVRAPRLDLMNVCFFTFFNEYSYKPW